MTTEIDMTQKAKDLLDKLAKDCGLSVEVRKACPAPVGGPPCPECGSTSTEPWEFEIVVEGQESMSGIAGHKCRWCGTYFANNVKLGMIYYGDVE